ncbi:hypothetical protein Hs30E_08480 [Lactococcus hodotermopsidis]|uniref:Uncharacterized protein n=1 Tax=Pseudolactococcus hodotermopsidis TaxID=2709157 RepID=A0A6A0BEN5_9LACT|nr:hypothetical protein [Lactococcus hodotermopsidis]GFH42297.1 hypothetical protein Hs30E_08480 [Lactococcus hodotermopsidis]
MIVINMAMMQDKVIELLNSAEGELTYKFTEKKGIKLFFEVTSGDVDTAAVEAKKLIKAQSWGSALYFNVEAV